MLLLWSSCGGWREWASRLNNPTGSVSGDQGYNITWDKVLLRPLTSGSGRSVVLNRLQARLSSGQHREPVHPPHRAADTAYRCIHDHWIRDAVLSFRHSGA